MAGAGSVSSVIKSLEFVSSSAPAIYLNEKLAEELFIAQLGAIGDFALSAARGFEAGANPPVVRVGASKDTSQTVTYDLGNPLTKALILHSAMGETAGHASSPGGPGTFMEAVGAVSLPPAFSPSPPPPEAATSRIMQAKDRQTAILQGFEDDSTVLMPLLLLAEDGIVGSVIDRQWVRMSWAASYLPLPQVVFGVVEDARGDFPLITLIYMRPYV